jgi:uncharacterized protein (UPF0332 family)
MFLAKAVKLLDKADTMLSVNLNEAAGRSAYLAGFHAAQALLFEHLGKVLKTHAGVHAEFLRLTSEDPRLNADLRASCRGATISRLSPTTKQIRKPA